MRRALPSIAAAALVACLLAAAVIASPSPPPARQGKGRGPLFVLAHHPTDLDPRLERFQDAPPLQANPSPPLEPVDHLAPNVPARPSRSVGQPWNGRLIDGMQLPPSGVGFFTFDSALRRSPSRGWRRWGTDQNVSRTMTVLAQFHDAHPDGPRVGVGDLSRTHGGPFGREYGGAGHASHQNGRDTDLYYPRRDRTEVPPAKVAQVDRRLAQELVDRFVKAGAATVFVGPHVGLRGPKGTVQKLVGHDDHLHVRWPDS